MVVEDDDGSVLALAGSGLDLSDFIRDFITSETAGVTPMIVDADGAIQAHQDRSLIVMNSGAGASSASGSNLLNLVDEQERDAVRAALEQVSQQPGSVVTLPVKLQGANQLLAVTYLPELDWYVANAVDLSTAEVIESAWVTPLLIVWVYC
ncbi:hypothetical protein ULF88_08745 [Halopseudomonas pachastrellae]|nr:hypothetical protein [Halopseudomonas pachastrellae]